MKKFERLPVESRREEIKTAAIQLFLEKGFRDTTMENIVENVTLSKGGVYRIYPSTKAILADIIMDGAAKRNMYYQQCAQELLARRQPVDEAAVAGIICDGMLSFPDISRLYAEFLIEKRRIPELEALYQDICVRTMEETIELIRQMHLSEAIPLDEKKMKELTDVMNTAILGIVVLEQREDFSQYRNMFMSALLSIMKGGEEDNDK